MKEDADVFINSVSCNLNYTTVNGNDDPNSKKSTDNTLSNEYLLQFNDENVPTVLLNRKSTSLCTIKSSPSHIRNCIYPELNRKASTIYSFDELDKVDNRFSNNSTVSSSSDVPDSWFHRSPFHNSSDELDKDIFSGPEHCLDSMRNHPNYRRRSSRLKKKRSEYKKPSPYMLNVYQKRLSIKKKRKKYHSQTSNENQMRNGNRWINFIVSDEESDNANETLSNASLSSDAKLKKNTSPNDTLSIQNVKWDDLFGLESHINTLRELVIWPLKYSHFFSKLGISAAKGVLFHGPPGTGKTMIARALAALLAETSPGGKRVSFFSRSSSELLSKWIGEAEKGLKNLFHQAKVNSPSIIFFDEFDGLAPRRTAKQDQSHISLVSTLLTLMDGLEDRENVIVIAATNRIDALDPALRRPGRFDRELYFGLPTAAIRKQLILNRARNLLATCGEDFIDSLVLRTEGLSFAEIKSLCVEAIFSTLRRLGGESWISSNHTTHHIEQGESISQEPIDWFSALEIVLTRHSNENFCDKIFKSNESITNDSYHKLLDEVVVQSLILMVIKPNSSFLSCIYYWASVAPVRHKKLIRIVSLDIYSLYSEGEYPSTPENRLVSIITSVQKRHSSMSTEENSITILLLPLLEKWRVSLAGTRCWKILKHFASSFYDLNCTSTNIRLLVTTEDPNTRSRFSNFVQIKFNF